MSMDVDVAVIGGGPAGAGAAIACARLGLEAALLEPMSVGGEAINVMALDEMPESQPVAGPDLVASLTERVIATGVDLRLGDGVTGIAPDGGGDGWRVDTYAGSLTAGAVVVCTGAGHVGLPGRPGGEEDALHGAGLFTCASCDGPLYSGRRVAVAGGGDTGVDAAITLSAYASEVVLFEREPELTCQGPLRDRLVAAPNVEVRRSTEVVGVLEGATVEGVRVRSAGVEEEDVAAGVMVAVGLRPRSELAAGIAELDADGAIVVGPDLATTAPGLYAAGDVRSGAPYRFAAAWGDGLTVAAAAVRHVRASAARSS